VAESKVNRNDPCPCGSGKKYKQCHLGKPLEEQQEANRRHWRIPILLTVIAAIVGIVLAIVSEPGTGGIIFVSAMLFIGGYVVLRKPPPPSDQGGAPGAINFGG
jgi:hypothetical protein